MAKQPPGLFMAPRAHEMGVSALFVLAPRVHDRTGLSLGTELCRA